VLFARPVHQRYLHSFPTRRSSDLGSITYTYPQINRVTEDINVVVYLKKVNYSKVRYDIVADNATWTDSPFDQGADGLFIDTKGRSEEHTSELQSRFDIVCRLLLEK